mgnify:CR=1 FL=1
MSLASKVLFHVVVSRLLLSAPLRLVSPCWAFNRWRWRPRFARIFPELDRIGQLREVSRLRVLPIIRSGAQRRRFRRARLRTHQMTRLFCISRQMKRWLILQTRGSGRSDRFVFVPDAISHGSGIGNAGRLPVGKGFGVTPAGSNRISQRAGKRRAFSDESVACPWVAQRDEDGPEERWSGVTGPTNVNFNVATLARAWVTFRMA